MKKRRKRKSRGVGVGAHLVIGLIAGVLYLVFVASSLFGLAIESEGEAVAICQARCVEWFGIGTWQTVENSDACAKGVYFCDCGDDWGG
ncbi:MAG: hypothetical protein DRP08_02670 [Candidatus Aenigmatarchaeota archaeon]|nr:MAG: hypothetical protein DRP08_02670 [Candidatus Aenigmarchaeota archaeon]